MVFGFVYTSLDFRNPQGHHKVYILSEGRVGGVMEALTLVGDVEGELGSAQSSAIPIDEQNFDPTYYYTAHCTPGRDVNSTTACGQPSYGASSKSTTSMALRWP